MVKRWELAEWSEIAGSNFSGDSEFSFSLFAVDCEM
jgi:hypothetical protein